MLYAAAGSSAIYNERLAIVLGVLTLLSVLAVYLSCRTCLNWATRLGWKDLAHNRIYAAFSRFHLYYWWAFGVLMVAHLLIAVIHTGLPESGDPDAAVHWWTLGLGLFSALTAVVVFSSCRVMPRLINMANQAKPLNNRVYRSFFQLHSYYWLVLALLAAAHFGVTFSHIGIWPGR